MENADGGPTLWVSRLPDRRDKHRTKYHLGTFPDVLAPSYGAPCLRRQGGSRKGGQTWRTWNDGECLDWRSLRQVRSARRWSAGRKHARTISRRNSTRSATTGSLP